MAELFKSYEIVRVPYWPKIARIVGPSVAFHIVLLLCIFYVPVIRDAVNVGGIFSGAKFVDKAYNKTHIGDDVDIIDMTAGEHFEYPDGYFSADGLPDPNAPVIIETANPPAPVFMPTPKPTPIPTPIPIPPPAPVPGKPLITKPPMGGGTMASRTKDGKIPGIPDNLQPDPSASPNPINAADPAKANQQADQLAADNNVNRPHDDEINRAPLKDFVNKANDLYDKGQLDFSKPIEVVIDAELDDSAHFTKANVVSKSGNTNLDEISKDMVAALSDSGALRFLMTKDGKSVELSKMRFIIRMDQANFTAQIESEAPNESRARQMALAYGLLLGAVPKLREGKDDEIAIANGTKVHAEGNKLIANFSMPRQQAVDLMKKQVAANKKPDS